MANLFQIIIKNIDGKRTIPIMKISLNQSFIFVFPYHIFIYHIMLVWVFILGNYINWFMHIVTYPFKLLTGRKMKVFGKWKTMSWIVNKKCFWVLVREPLWMQSKWRIKTKVFTRRQKSTQTNWCVIIILKSLFYLDGGNCI